MIYKGKNGAKIILNFTLSLGKVRGKKKITGTKQNKTLSSQFLLIFFFHYKRLGKVNKDGSPISPKTERKNIITVLVFKIYARRPTHILLKMLHFNKKLELDTSFPQRKF